MFIQLLAGFCIFAIVFPFILYLIVVVKGIVKIIHFEKQARLQNNDEGKDL